MGATTLPAPLEASAREPLAPAARRPGRRRDRLERKLRFAVAGVSLPMVALSGLAIAGLPGPWAWVAGGVGLAGLGIVAVATRWLTRGVVVPAIRASQAARAMSAGDLTRPIAAGDAAELRPMLEALEEVRRGLVRLVADVRAGTTHVATNSSQITRDNEALSQRTGTQAESVQRTAATMEELTAAIRHNAENTRQANALVHSAAQRAEHGGAVVGEVVRVMDSIRDSSQSIRDIIAVIDGIAFQTNILALNAAVEAARAGEHGRGFAVVAGEVRTLSQRCAASAREVKELVGRSVEQVESAGPRVDEAGRAMAEIVAAVRQAAELIAHIDASGREQSAGIESVNEAIARIDQVTQDNFALVQDAGRTAASLHQRAVTLLKGTSAFDLGAREQGSREEAVELVRQAAEFCRAHGRDALVADVNRLAEGRFVDRDLYLMVIDAHNIILAHGNNPRTVGGPAQAREMVTVARAHGEGWVSYKWNHPVTNEVLTKTTFVRRVGDVVVACGVYAGAAS